MMKAASSADPSFTGRCSAPAAGPATSPPKRQGFGARLLDFVLPGQIQAKASIEWHVDGLRVHCLVPMALEANS